MPRPIVGNIGGLDYPNDAFKFFFAGGDIQFMGAAFLGNDSLVAVPIFLDLFNAALPPSPIAPTSSDVGSITFLGLLAGNYIIEANSAFDPPFPSSASTMPTRAFRPDPALSFLCVSSWFERGDLAEAAQVPLGLAEFGREERLDEIPSELNAHHPPAHAEDVHVIVLDTLPGGEVVLDQPRANTRYLVGADGRADAAAADRHAALHRPRRHGPGKRDDEVGIVVAGAQAMGAEIDDLVPRRAEPADDLLLQAEAAVIGGDPHSHVPTSRLRGHRRSSELQSPAAARSASTRAWSRRTRPAGIDRSPARRRASIPTFSLPVTTHRRRRDRFSMGYVSVIRRLP